MHPAQKHQTSIQARSTTLRTAKRYSPVALGATLLLALSACSGGATTASPSATVVPSPSATSAKATASPTRHRTVTESTPTCRYRAHPHRGGYREPRNHHHRKPGNDCSGDRAGERSVEPLRIG